MSDTPKSRAARLAHLRRGKLTKGDAVPLPLTMATIFHLPGDPAGFRQYGRTENPTWEAVEEMLGPSRTPPAWLSPPGWPQYQPSSSAC